jgi:hypothetical protein
MSPWHWLIRAVVGACAIWLFMQWQTIAAQWAALFSWLLCAGGAELIIAVSPTTKDRRHAASPPRRGGRRRTDPRLD